MGRFYVELSVTVYADSEDKAMAIARRAVAAIRNECGHEVGSVEIENVDADPDNGTE